MDSVSSLFADDVYPPAPRLSNPDKAVPDSRVLDALCATESRRISIRLSVVQFPMSLLQRLQPRRQRGDSVNSQSPAHMTWARSSMIGTFSRTGVFLKRQLWVWPIIAIALLSIVGLLVHRAIESTMKANLESQLTTLLAAETAMLDQWYDVQSSNAEAAANNLRFRESIYQLLEADESATSASGNAEEVSTIRRDISRTLSPTMSSHDYVGYFVVDRTRKIIASSHSPLLGQQSIADYDRFLSKAMDGNTVISPPFASVVMMEDEAGRVRTGEPTMYVCAPIRDASFQIVGALALQLRPEREFTRILQLGRMGSSGETYAFDNNGVMVSNSRFDSDLILLGILPDQELSRSILHVHLRDPSDDMTKGFRPKVRRSEMPLTVMAEQAIKGKDGVNVEGYRDYRGVNVVGAWTWMAKHDIGVATEIDQAEAFHPLTILRRTFWGLYSLLVVSAIAIFIFMVVVARLQRDARNAAIEAQQLGQYTLEEKLGAGAMGVVYKGHHAMLRRPTAIKLLNTDKVDDTSIQRFEREVQITCRLNHPSTIAIYDYGRTPEDVFYYAMEYLDGIDLQDLVNAYGPQPGGRVIALLLQVCGSLYEAHSQGLVHRDIKPANIMISRRGGVPDVAKVLDFGLVKALDEEPGGGSNGGGLTGTPLYMSPESIQTPMSVDGRSDLYGVGAIGYFLLTGKPVFKANSLVELCRMHVDEAPIPPSEMLGSTVSPELEHALLSCLEKSRSKRPQTARDLATLLEKCPEVSEWSVESADAWWSKYERAKSGADSSLSSSSQSITSQSDYTRTIIIDDDDRTAS